MARVNHKKIKQLIAQKQKTVTDRQFFASRALAVYFEDIAAAQTKRYGYRRRVKVRIVWVPKKNDVAHTDNGLIWINAGHESVTMHKTREARYEQVCGLFAHELGHILYTDFLALQTYHQFQKTGTWYPEPPPLRNVSDRSAETEYRELLQSDPQSQKALCLISHQILNALEDGYIEQRMLMEFPGILGTNLQIMRDSTFEQIPTLSQLVEQEEEDGHIWISVLQCILEYMEWGQIKYGETPITDERIKVVFSLLGELDTALISRDFRERCRTANIILIRCWRYIKDFMERCKSMAEQAAGGGSEGSPSSMIQQLLSALAGGSAEGTGETAPVSGGPTSSTGGAPTAKQRAATARLATGVSKEDEKSGPSSAVEDGGGEGDDSKEQEAEASSGNSLEENEGTGKAGSSTAADSSDCMPFGGGGIPPNACQPVSGTEIGRIPLTETAQVSVPEGGEIERDDEYAGTGYTNAAADIERVLERIAENSVCTELERQRTKELTELAQSISYGDIHQGVSKTVHRMAEVDDCLMEQYDKISNDLIRISKQLQKSVTQQFVSASDKM